VDLEIKLEMSATEVEVVTEEMANASLILVKMKTGEGTKKLSVN